MQTLAQIRDLLASRGLSPRKFLGQNFLIDHNLLRRFVDAAAIEPGGTVLEVGPGTGTLTEELLARGARVVACEMDIGLAAMLRERFADQPGFTLVEGDCLATKRRINPELLAAIGPGRFDLVANLPYGAATPLMTRLLADDARCRSLCVTIQLEVAERLAASPGTKEYGPLSILARTVATMEWIARPGPECFWPRPEVTSAMVRLVRRQSDPGADPIALLAFCELAFSQRRKQLGSVLGRNGPWPDGITPTMRAEELSPEQFIRLLHARGEGAATDDAGSVG